MSVPFSKYIASYELKGCHLFFRSADGQSWDVDLRDATAETFGGDDEWLITAHGVVYHFDPSDNPSGLTLADVEAMLEAGSSGAGHSNLIDIQSPGVDAAVVWNIGSRSALLLTTNGTHVLSMTNPPPAGFMGDRRLKLIKTAGGDSITWPAYISNAADYDVSADPIGTYVYGIDCYAATADIVGKIKVA